MLTADVTAKLSAAALEETDRVLVAGDWHTNLGWARYVLTCAAELGVRTVLHVGDLGVGPWPGQRSSFVEDLGAALDATDTAVLVTGGNHENWDTIDTAPRDDLGRAVLHPRLVVAPRPHRWTMCGLRFASLGGAFSVNRADLVPGSSWWPQEEPTPAQARALIDGGPVDVLLTHEVPTSAPVRPQVRLREDVGRAASRTRVLLDHVVDATGPQLMFAGHWHQRLTHTLPGPAGARLEVLNMDGTSGNAVVLDVLTGSCTALPRALGRAYARADR